VWVLAFWVYSIIGLGLAIAYVWLIRLSLQAWESLPLASAKLPGTAPKVSVLVPGRNEAKHLPESLAALLQQDYPAESYEVLFIDDHSTDDSLAIAQSMEDPKLRVIELNAYLNPEATIKAYKKKALQLGIQLAQHDIILTTDADCQVSPHWVQSMVSGLEKNDWQAVTGPVLGHKEQNALQRFQSLDFAGMMLMTAAGLKSGQFTLGNGASLGFRRSAFEAVGGYRGNEVFASGDDVFLLRKIAEQFPGKLGFLKNARAAVHTEMKPDWHSFTQQRLRWGTKNSQAASGWGATLALGVVFLLSWMIVLTPVIALWVGLPALVLFAVLLGAKAVSDRLLLGTAAQFFQRRDLLRAFWLMETLHIGYIAVVGLLSLVVREYEWKGRRVA
jgi:cellulose synthase/poly-beta-1,6-N-acetylglucosamine synthase-like glycosyltransferase